MATYGALRIVRRPRALGAQGEEIQEYWERLARIAPSEVTGFYLTFRPLVVGDLSAEEIRSDILAPWWPWIGVALVLFVRVWATRGSPKWSSAQWLPVTVATLAFVLWVVTMGHYIAFLSDLAVLKDARVSAVLAAVFTFVVPYFYKGDPPPAPKPSVGTP